jgi:hypothetical protein
MSPQEGAEALRIHAAAAAAAEAVRTHAAAAAAAAAAGSPAPARRASVVPNAYCGTEMAFLTPV